MRCRHCGGNLRSEPVDTVHERNKGIVAELGCLLRGRCDRAVTKPLPLVHPSRFAPRAVAK